MSDEAWFLGGSSGAASLYQPAVAMALGAVSS